MKVRLYFCFYALLMAFASLFSGCSADDSTPSEAADEIRVITDVWQMMEGTRATTFDNATALQTEGNFTCTIYDENSTTVHYPATQVDWSTDHWEFHNVTYRWPVTEALDFFAYMPASMPSYITAINYAVSGEPAKPAPQFTCTNLPMTNSGQSDIKEFVYALTTGQDNEHQGATGVTMKFYHPFARINMQLSSSQPDIKINSITFKGLKTGGVCTFSYTPAVETSIYNTSTWTSLTPTESTQDFVVSLNNGNYSANANLGSYLMVPQGFSGNIEVKATWIDWGELFEHTVSTKIDAITWQPGYSYTYTFTISETDLRVNVEKFTEQW